MAALCLTLSQGRRGPSAWASDDPRVSSELCGGGDIMRAD